MWKRNSHKKCRISCDLNNFTYDFSSIHVTTFFIYEINNFIYGKFHICESANMLKSLDVTFKFHMLHVNMNMYTILYMKLKILII